MKKNIWIFNHYGCTPKTGSVIRHFTFAKNLKDKGYNAKIFASNQLHYVKSTFDVEDKAYKEYTDEAVPVVFINTPKYDNNGIKRVENMLSYFLKLFSVTKQIVEKGGEKPDVIIASSPHPLTCIAGIFIARRYKVPCIVEIRDLWPESIVEYSTRFSKNHPLIKILYQGEKWIYKKADKIILTMPCGYDYIKEKKWDKVIPESKCFHINNGVDLEAFDFNKENFKIHDVDLENKDIFKIVYTGSIRTVNNLGILLDCAKTVANPKIKFLIWGDGDEVLHLKNRVVNEKITNVCFKGRVDKKYVPFILSNADVNLCHNSDSKLFRFGISFNKLFDYYASGKPILMTFKPGANPIDLYNCGFNCKIENMQEIIDRMLDEKEYNLMCNGAKVAVNDFDFKTLTDKLIEVIEG